jgi:hypothetical protein
MHPIALAGLSLLQTLHCTKQYQQVIAPRKETVWKRSGETSGRISVGVALKLKKVAIRSPSGYRNTHSLSGNRARHPQDEYSYRIYAPQVAAHVPVVDRSWRGSSPAATAEPVAPAGGRDDYAAGGMASALLFLDTRSAGLVACRNCTCLEPLRAEPSDLTRGRNPGSASACTGYRSGPGSTSARPRILAYPRQGSGPAQMAACRVLDGRRVPNSGHFCKLTALVCRVAFVPVLPPRPRDLLVRVRAGMCLPRVR